MTKHWALSYIGTPYKSDGRTSSGVDCWGLVQLIYREQFGMVLADYPGLSALALKPLSSIAKRVLDNEWIEVAKPFDGALVAMSQHKAIHHVGIYTTADGGKIVHSRSSQNAIVDTKRNLVVIGFRLFKFYRHNQWPT